jgi:hypothetical protein
MADLFEPLRLKTEEFSELITGLERAFSRHAAALINDERLQSPEVEVLDWKETGFSEETVEKFRQVVTYLDQLIVFAFADAPDEIVAEWAGRFDASLKDEAVKRVGIMRDDMPSLRSLWEAKTSSVVPLLGSVGYEVVTSEADGTANDKSLILSFSASKYSILGRVDTKSTQSITVRLWRSDLILLKREIEHVLKDHFD